MLTGEDVDEEITRKPPPEPGTDSGKPVSGKLVRRTLRLILGTAVFCATEFGIAGRLDWLGAWALAAFFFFYLLFVLIWGTRNAPELLDERGSKAANVKNWDKIIMKLYSFLLISLFILASLDAGRFRWSHTSAQWQISGGLIVVLAGGIIFWCFRTNAFLSSRARIQDDRGHSVVRSGPYRYVRHPMYISLIILMPGVALLLGSWWALAPAGMIAILFVIRTGLEDRMLREELPGYQDYASSVRYRLLPGMW
jgi:protein-S-isoprenylcysteine O-methyltransferase Ste14